MVVSEVWNSFASVLMATLTTVTSRIDMIAPRTTTIATSRTSRSSLSLCLVSATDMPNRLESASVDAQRDVDVAARGVRVRAHLVRRPHDALGQLAVLDAREADVQ